MFFSEITVLSFCQCPSVAGLITRFLPAIEAFFIVNVSSPSDESQPGATEETDPVIDNSRVLHFAACKILSLTY